MCYFTNHHNQPGQGRRSDIVDTINIVGPINARLLALRIALSACVWSTTGLGDSACLVSFVSSLAFQRIATTIFTCGYFRDIIEGQIHGDTDAGV